MRIRCDCNEGCAQVLDRTLQECTPHLAEAPVGNRVQDLSLATTGQLVRGLGCWEGEDLRWRAPPRVEREERA